MVCGRCARAKIGNAKGWNVTSSVILEGVQSHFRCAVHRVRRPFSKFRGGCARSAEHTSELQSPMRNSYAAFCLKQKITPLSTHTGLSSTYIAIVHDYTNITN